MTKQAKIANQIKRYIRQVADAGYLYPVGSKEYEKVEKIFKKVHLMLAKEFDKLSKQAKALAKKAETAVEKKHYEFYGGEAERGARSHKAWAATPMHKQYDYRSGIRTDIADFVLGHPISRVHRGFPWGRYFEDTKEEINKPRIDILRKAYADYREARKP